MMENLSNKYDNVKKMFVMKEKDNVVICLIDVGGIYKYTMRDLSIFGISCGDFGMEVIVDEDEGKVFEKMKESYK